MPNQTYTRFWCKKCQNYELFSKEIGAKTVGKCNECDEESTGYHLDEVPKEKLLQQRERYKLQQKRKSQKRFMGLSLLGLGGYPMLDWPEPSIVETDAGQKTIDEEREIEVRRIATEKRAKIDKEIEEAQVYKHVGRNDMCTCGSGLKFKKCHLNLINTQYL